MTTDGSKSTAVANNLMTRIEFLPTLVDKLKKSPESVIADLKEFRDKRESLYPGLLETSQ